MSVGGRGGPRLRFLAPGQLVCRCRRKVMIGKEFEPETVSF